MLTLPIKKKWFEMILSGEKKEEYRDRSRYYHQRFWPYLGQYKNGETDEWKRREVTIRFRNGYSSDSRSFVAVCTIDTGQGRPEWGAEPGKNYYRLQIKRIISKQAEESSKGG